MHLLELVRIFPHNHIIQTGSRLFGDATNASDWDYVVLVDDVGEEMTERLAPHGFELCHDAYTDDDHLIVRRKTDNLNLILTDSSVKFEMWQRCTRVSRMLALNKEQRKVLFSAFIDADE